MTKIPIFIPAPGDDEASLEVRGVIVEVMALVKEGQTLATALAKAKTIILAANLNKAELKFIRDWFQRLDLTLAEEEEGSVTARPKRHRADLPKGPELVLKRQVRRTWPKPCFFRDGEPNICIVHQTEGEWLASGVHRHLGKHRS